MYLDPRDADSIDAAAGILVTELAHSLVPRSLLIPDLDEPLYVVRVTGSVRGGGQRTETLLLRPAIAASLFCGNVIAAIRSDTVDVFERALSEHLRKVTGGQANVHVVRLDRVREN